MAERTLKTGYGVLRGPDGQIQNRINLDSGATVEVPDGHSIEEFNTFDDVLALNWPPQATLSLSSESITADGQDAVTVTVQMEAEQSRDWGTATLSIAGDSFEADVSDGTHSETVTTTTTDASIPVEVEHPEHRGDSATIEVVQP